MNYLDTILKKTKSKNLPDMDSLYYKYLNNQAFRGFYYDTEDKSYGIVLEFGKYLNGRINLFAQLAKGNMNIIEYQIQCDTYSFENIAYDKVLITSSNYKSDLLLPEEGDLLIPKRIEFSVQILTRNSVYLRFMEADKFTPPINSFKGGLVLAREHQKSKSLELPAIETQIIT